MIDHVPVIREHVLLVYTVIRSVFLPGISVRIFCGKNPLHPDIDREGIEPVQAKERSAAGHLDSDSVQLRQGCYDAVLITIFAFFPLRVIFSFILLLIFIFYLILLLIASFVFIPLLISILPDALKFPKVELSFEHSFCSCTHICTAVAEPAGTQLICRKQDYSLRSGKCKVWLSSRVPPLIAAGLAEKPDRAADRRDIFVLGNDEAYQRLPRILPEDPDPFFILGGIHKERIFLRVDPFADTPVILSKVKVIPPVSLKLVFSAIEIEASITERTDIEASVACENTVRGQSAAAGSALPGYVRSGSIINRAFPAFLCRKLPAEALSAVCYFIKIKIVFRVKYHRLRNRAKNHPHPMLCPGQRVRNQVIFLKADRYTVHFV